MFVLQVVVVADPGTDADDPLRQNRSREKRYAFDCAFGPDTDQETVYAHTTQVWFSIFSRNSRAVCDGKTRLLQFLIDGVLNGFNASVFAYGATGAGKTFTMLGTAEHPGIMILTLRDLFRKIETITHRGGAVNVSDWRVHRPFYDTWKLY